MMRTPSIAPHGHVRILYTFADMLQALFLVIITSLSLFAPSIGATSLFAQYRFAFPFPIFQNESHVDSSLTSFIVSESAVALQGVLDNIGSEGAKASGAGAGLIIASPSRADPNYFFTWSRDSALTIKLLIDLFIAGNKTLQPIIEDYVLAQAKLQKVGNPSGGLANGLGLGEPKFEAHGTSFIEAWGRPQKDGPALRASALITYSKWLIVNGQKSEVISKVWPIVRNDLSFVGQYWNRTGFDLWEEVEGSSFFTTAVQHRALVEGAELARQLDEECEGCISQAPEVLCFLQSYWNEKHILANFPVNDNGRSAIDANTLLGSIHTFDPITACDDSTFQPCSARALANHKVVTDSFRSIYKINSGIAQGSAVAVGRYEEDTYNGSPQSGLGNPWYLNTLAAAEQLYDALYQWDRIGYLTVTSTSLEFFHDFSSTIEIGTYQSSSYLYQFITSAIRTYADGYLSIVQRHTPSNGALSEQFSRDDGKPLSAVHLTWSYASFLTAVASRASNVPISWNELSRITVPESCAATSADGIYAPAIPDTPCTGPAPSTIALTFNVLKATAYGQNIFLTGSIPQLGSFDENKAIPLSADTFTSSNPRWHVVVDLPAGTSFDYKYTLEEADGTTTRENGIDRNYSVPIGNCGDDIWVFDTYRG